MTALIYNVDTEKEVTPLMVRDALVECFVQAHCNDTGIDVRKTNLNETYCRESVKKMFDDSGVDYDHPTKEDIVMVIKQLGDFSLHFRDASVIQKHQAQMMTLVESIP